MYLLGVFEHSDRIEFYEELVSTMDAQPATTPVARQLLSNFGFPPSLNSEVSEIDVSGYWMSGGGMLSGYVLARSHEKQGTHRLATIVEFREWAYGDSQAFAWLSFTLVVFGLAIDTFLYLMAPAT